MEQNLISKLQANKDQGFKWQERRHPQWAESYELDRDVVVNNRLLQRQSVNIPLMKMTRRTLMSKFKKRSAESIIFEDLGGDKQKDIFKNEYWKHFYKTARLKAKDRANKKQVMLYGRTFWKLLIADGRADAEVVDPHDVLVDRYADPADVDGTSQFLVHLHIYRTLKELEGNPAYDKEAIGRLKSAYSTEAGLVKAAENAQSAAAKNQRLTDLGVSDVENPQVGETIVELNEHYVKLWDDGQKKFRYHLVTVVDDQILRQEPLEEVLGATTDGYWDDHLPYVTWGDDEDRSDFWSDGIADIIRTINKVLNAWFSQLVENRTLRNLGMNFYDATANSDWTPTTMEPRPFGWYPLPGKPGEVYQKVDIPDLTDSLDEIQFLITIAEQATAATATQKGTSEKSQITLGEVKMMLVEAEDRINDMQEPYDDSWLEFGEKWSRLSSSAADQLEPVKLYKKSYNGNYFPAEVRPSDWLSADGYACTIKSAADHERDRINGIQKLLAIKAQFPGNRPLDKIAKQKLLDLGELTPEEAKQVMDYDEQLARMGAMMPAAAPAGQPPTNPQQRNVVNAGPAPALGA